MAKSQTSYSTNAANNLLNQAQGLTTPILNSFQQSLVGSAGQQSNLYGRLSDTLSNQMQYGGYDPTQLANLRTETQNLYDTGGYDPNQLGQITGGYYDLSQGGMSPQQQQAFLRASTEGSQATYGALSDQAKRASIATGGLGTGGAISQMARQGTQQQDQATLNANVALQQLLTQNKIAGLGGEANLASNVAGARQQGAAQQLGLESGVQQGSLSATNIMNQLYNTTTGEISDLGNKMLQTLGLNFGTQSEALAALTNLSKNPGMFQTIYGDILAGGKTAAGVMAAAG